MGTNLPRYKIGKSIICCKFLWKATITSRNTTLVKQGEIKIMESLRRSRNSSHLSGFLQSWEEVWSQVNKRRGDKPSVRKWEKWGKWEEVWSQVDRSQVVSENGNVSTQPAACAGGNNTQAARDPLHPSKAQEHWLCTTPKKSRICPFQILSFPPKYRLCKSVNLLKWFCTQYWESTLILHFEDCTTAYISLEIYGLS